jgi:hypothetical protein
MKDLFEINDEWGEPLWGEFSDGIETLEINKK